MHDFFEKVTNGFMHQKESRKRTEYSACFNSIKAGGSKSKYNLSWLALKFWGMIMHYKPYIFTQAFFRGA